MYYFDEDDNRVHVVKANIIADSVSYKGKRITTFELEYPRFIHSELMTHRLFSRNAASSRAVPIDKMIRMVWRCPARPLHWGANQSGMQAENTLSGMRKWFARKFWMFGSKLACAASYLMYKCGAHKQIVNRITEPFQMYKTIVTATEFDNWFHLRTHKDAQPEIKALADCMLEEYKKSSPRNLNPGEWHLPYINTFRRSTDGELLYETAKYGIISLPQAQKISASCCAQVSYRTLDNSIDVATKIFDKLVNSKPVHASPFEHLGTPIVDESSEGVTHTDKNGNLWSGNFRGWIQYRQLIDGNTCWDFGEIEKMR